MISRIVDCTECKDILSMIDAINCKIYEMSLVAYNNTVFGLNLYIDQNLIMDLVTYKDILTRRYVQPLYDCTFTLERISSRVRMLTAGCKSCVRDEVIYVFSTSTTSTSSSTTSTTTLAPITTTTTTTVGFTFFLYDTTRYNCGACNSTGAPFLDNDVELEVGKFYLNIIQGTVVFINALVDSNSDSVGTHRVNPSSVAGTCAGVPCPSTSSTTTQPCQRFLFSYTNLICGTCNVGGGGSFYNDEMLTVGKFYYDPEINRVLQITGYTSCDTGLSGKLILNSSGKNTCAEVICGTSFSYSYTSFFGGTCNVDASGTLLNGQLLSIGKFYLHPTLGIPIQINAFLGVINVNPDVLILDITKQDICALINLI